MQNNPIKPNTKIRILSPEHLDYVISFTGIDVQSSTREEILCRLSSGDELFIYFDDCWGADWWHYDYAPLNRYVNLMEEIFIDLPADINSRILAEKVTAAQILEAGLGHMKDRAVTYDNDSGERSMSATVEAFNAITGHQLTEEQGWHFMTLLKIVRSQQGATKLDNYEDGAAYFGLAGEAAMRGAK